ncbi:ATP-binding protein [Falsiroseomonas stagni]|uniref:histidine kinase n=1 Tax=Falsiroseomonas stagni DSM 19981 TaxID=1123062 RepID=A0A1I3X6C3_9PROT|nr:ATP-binding protein [Falsiroseomonas stagni]SFK15163.1 PAS domain S-box-containing protein [Falsiroseomonas stagni DSM 19981]
MPLATRLMNVRVASARGAPRRWLAWTAALCIAAALLFAGEALIARLSRDATESARVEAEAAADVVHQVLLRRLEAVEVLHRLTQSWLVLRESGNDQGRSAIETELASTVNAGQFGFVQVAIIGGDGWMLWSSIPGSGAPVHLGDREHFQVHARGLRSLFVSIPLVGRVSQRWTVQLTRPLLASDGGFSGVAVVSMDLHDLSDALADIQFRPQDSAMILRGTLRAAHSRLPGTAIGTELSADDPLRRAQPDQMTGSTLRNTPEGQASITAWRRVAGTPLTVAYIQDYAASQAGVANLALLVRLTAGAGGAMTLMMVWVGLSLRARAVARRAAETADIERSLAQAASMTYARRIAGLPGLIYGGDIRPDGSFTLTHASESAERVIGWTASHLLDMPDPHDLMEPDDAARQADFYAGVALHGEGQREFRIRRADGQWIWARDSARVVDRRADGSVEMVGYIADISDERAIQAKLQNAGRLTTLGEMATGLAHELNQPLAVMSLAADNASRALQRRGGAALPDIQERLSRIGQQAQRARDIVDHLRVFGRSDEGEPGPLPLARAVEGASVLTNGALHAAGIDLAIDLPADLPPVMARLVPLEQAIVNLLMNARDAIEEHRPDREAQGWIRIAAAVEGPVVTMTIADSGGGIPASHLDRLFEPFFTTKAPGKGTGLGLPLVHAAMKAFGGSISATNGPDGAVMTLTFPIAGTVASKVDDPARQA